MHNVKAADLVSARALVAEAGPRAEQALLGRLSPELASVYGGALPTSWIPIEQITPIYEAAAAALFQGAPDPGFELGKAMAARSYSGLYRAFLSIPSMSFLVRMAASVWSSYHSAGKASAEDVSASGGVLVVRGAPELAPAHRAAVAGHLAFLAENCGYHDVRIVVDDANAQAWRWRGSWS